MLSVASRTLKNISNGSSSVKRTNHFQNIPQKKAISIINSRFPIRTTSRYLSTNFDDDGLNTNTESLLGYFARKPESLESKPSKPKPIQKSQEKSSNFKSFIEEYRSLNKPGKSEVTKTAKAEKPATKWIEKPIPAEDAGTRLDKFIHRLYPKLPNSRINKMLREKKIMLSSSSSPKEWKKAEGNDRIEVGGRIKILVESDSGKDAEKSLKARPKAPLSDSRLNEVLSWILHKDDDIIIINKPTNLAVQGGTGIRESIDDMMSVFQFEKANPPQLVHRLDQGATGLLILARDRLVAKKLAKEFADHQVNKLYWALCVGAPKRLAGTIKVGLTKTREAGDDSEKVYVADMNPDDKTIKMSNSRYNTIVHTHNVVSLLALRPKTGRTHQLRVHCAQVLKTPILGDYKYGQGCPETLADVLDYPGGQGVPLHLHSREVAFKHPRTGKPVHFQAPIPPHMENTMKRFDYHLLSNSIPQATLSEEEKQLKPTSFEFTEGKLTHKLRMNKLKKSESYQKEVRKNHALREKAMNAPKRLRPRLAAHKKEGTLSFKSFKPKPIQKAGKKSTRSKSRK